MSWIRICALGATGLLLAACGGDDGGGGPKGTAGAGGNAGSAAASGGSGGGSAGSGGGSAGIGGGTAGVGGGAGTAGSAGSAGSGGNAGSAGSGGAAPTCDFEIGSNGVLVMEAESLKLSGSWQASQKVAGASGGQYIEWTGASSFNSPGQGLITVKIGIDQPGRYRLQWRSRIGAGSDPTEHNDTWVRFPDAESAYGVKTVGGGETRRYPKPKCNDSTFMASINALPNVVAATCPKGSTSDNWFKVYCSGATNWKWSTHTSDSDAHDVYAEFKTAGTYTLELSARSTKHLVDRIVLHRESVADSVARDEKLSETTCK